jgi:hypothetical protein
VLVRRVVPGPAEPSVPMPQPAQVAAPTQALAPLALAPVALAPVASALPVRPRRPTTRVAEVDLSGLRRISGFLGGCLVDSLSGTVMAGDAADEATTRSNVAVARANLQALEALDPGEAVDDIQIALGRKLHLIRPLESAPRVFVCVALDAVAANPGIARVQLRRVAQAVRL